MPDLNDPFNARTFLVKYGYLFRVAGGNIEKFNDGLLLDMVSYTRKTVQRKRKRIPIEEAYLSHETLVRFVKRDQEKVQTTLEKLTQRELALVEKVVEFQRNPRDIYLNERLAIMLDGFMPETYIELRAIEKYKAIIDPRHIKRKHENGKRLFKEKIKRCQTQSVLARLYMMEIEESSQPDLIALIPSQKDTEEFEIYFERIYPLIKAQFNSKRFGFKGLKRLEGIRNNLVDYLENPKRRSRCKKIKKIVMREARKIRTEMLKKKQLTLFP